MAAWAWKLDCPWSTSAIVSAPLVVSLTATTLESSWTAPLLTPAMTGTSLVPVMVTVTARLAVPSKETAVKVSEIGRAAGRGRVGILGVAGGLGKKKGSRGGRGPGGPARVGRGWEDELPRA